VATLYEAPSAFPPTTSVLSSRLRYGPASDAAITATQCLTTTRGTRRHAPCRRAMHRVGRLRRPAVLRHSAAIAEILLLSTKSLDASAEKIASSYGRRRLSSPPDRRGTAEVVPTPRQGHPLDMKPQSGAPERVSPLEDLGRWPPAGCGVHPSSVRLAPTSRQLGLVQFRTGLASADGRAGHRAISRRWTARARLPPPRRPS